MTKSINNFSKNPNPQGKGLVPVLRDLGSLQAVAPAVKSSADFLRDYCISSMVLAAKFSFKPVPGTDYYLYAMQDEWNLSLIAPDEWSRHRSERFIGKCQLRSDMTWEIATEGINEESTAIDSARNFIRGFVDNLGEQESITSHLPFYVSELPYYQRMLATALASSLQHSIPAEGYSAQTLLETQQSLATLIGPSR
jgi:hypothetical protein